MGSTLLARIAGIHAAISATSVRTIGAATKTTGSAAVTPNRKLEIQPRQAECREDTDDNANNRQAHSLEDDHLLHSRRIGAERETYPDFLCPLLDRVRHQAVDANRRQRESCEPERGHKPHVEPLARQ